MFENVKKIYIMGIGGISMSAIALLLKDRGFIVSGCDSHLSSLTQKLEKEGIKVLEGSAPEFAKECDACIITSAIGEDNRDIKLLKELGKTILSRSQVLGFLASEKKCISISGTHGKTTTTGMLATIMLKAGLDPTIHIGGILNEINSNLHIGKGEYFLTEACEYKDSFLSLNSYISVVLNIEPDHMDYFKNEDNLHNSFKKFAKNTEKYGFCVINNNINNILYDKSLNTLTYGQGGFLQARDIKQHLPGRYAFNLYIDNQYIDEIKLSAFGIHNIENSLAVIGVSLLLDIDLSIIKEGLLEYKGVARRMEHVSDSPFVIHDYAHHPTEIRATLSACKQMSERIVAIFQPHTYTRTQDLYSEFLSCFDGASEVWLLPIYAARENPIEGITSEQLVKDLNERGIKSRYFPSFEECKQVILEGDNNNLFAILGAGDIEKLANMMKKQ
ncbi:MAG: UDP-N-acetylmuramate--L-alanine ligase [Clostridia bacterium]|nr:UDP-N-acetylmuramate--L-alanine ligase [Clostridia bacterium]